MEIKVRFAPSPTGYLHVGGLRTALYNYLFAKKVGGKLVLRIEDTDQNRIVEDAVKNLMITFKKLNINFDEGPDSDGGNGPYFQSERLSIYRKYIKFLLDNGDAYPCFCSSERLEEMKKKKTQDKIIIKYDRHCMRLKPEKIIEKMVDEPYVIRMKVPADEEVIFFDSVRNRIVIRCEEIDDQILMKSDGYPTYHFANVVDDHLMGITHVMRGEEWLPSTPKHVLLYQFFNWELPKFIHLPLLLNPDKSKLSKRQGSVAVEGYLKKGFLPEAIINFVALLGWHPQNEQEIFSISELEKEFSINRIQKSGAVFDDVKLKWINSQYLMNMNLATIAQMAHLFYTLQGVDISDEKKYLQIVDNARRRVNTLSEMPDESQMFYRNPDISKENLKFINSDISLTLLQTIYTALSAKTNCDSDQFKTIIMESGKSVGVKGKDLFHPIRIVLYGNPKGPDIPLLFSILGRNEILSRLSNII